MKNDVMPSIVQMEADELQQLTAEVKETLATSHELTREKPIRRSFGLVDLWNIHRNAKFANASMRR